jgi:outer membrane protein assembly factor BamB
MIKNNLTHSCQLRNYLLLPCVLLTCLLFTTSAAPAAPTEPSSENWPGWRGPRGDGTSSEKSIPTHWSPTKNIKWKTPISGIGHASPIVWGNAIFTVTCDTQTNKRSLICINRTDGKIKWNKTVLTTKLERKHNLNSYASSTPVTDGKTVYVSFLEDKSMFIAAYDFKGNQLWSATPGIFSSRHGYCASPIIYKDKLIINGDHDGNSYIVAINRNTGKTIWKTKRENSTRSYCTPIIREIEGKTQMILSGDKSVTSYDPNTGKLHWIIDGPTQQYVASLVYNGDLLFLTCGFPEQHLMAIDPRGSGNVTKTHVKWHHETKDASYVPSPISEGKYFFLADDFGTCNCYEAATGKTIWREKLARHFSASLVSAAGLIYYTADQGLERKDKGVTFVIKPGPTLNIIATNTLNEPIYASPAISQSNLYLRGEKHLFCIGE